MSLATRITAALQQVGLDVRAILNAPPAFPVGNLEVGLEGNLLLRSVTTQPTPPPSGMIQLYPMRRAGMDWFEVQFPNGMEFPVQPHFGLNRIATWSPLSSTSVAISGMPRSAVGTASTPALTSTNLSTSSRRWRMQSAATANAAAEERNATNTMWRGNASGLGGFTYINRISMALIPVLTRAFFGVHSSTGALSTSQNPKSLINCVGIGFTEGVDTNWQVYHNDASGAVTEIDMGASFPISSLTNVYTLFIVCQPNDSSIWIRIKEEVGGAIFEEELTTNIPANNVFLNVRNYMNNGGTLSAVAYECSGAYLKTDY